MTNPHRRNRGQSPEHRKSIKDIHLGIEKQNRLNKVKSAFEFEAGNDGRNRRDRKNTLKNRGVHFEEKDDNDIHTDTEQRALNNFALNASNTLCGGLPKPAIFCLNTANLFLFLILVPNGCVRGSTLSPVLTKLFSALCSVSV